MAESSVYTESKGKENLWILGTVAAFLILPPTWAGTMAVLMLTPLFAILIFSAKWLFGDKGVAVATAISLLFSIFLFVHSLISWLHGG